MKRPHLLSITGRVPWIYSHPNNERIYPWVNALAITPFGFWFSFLDFVYAS